MSGHRPSYAVIGDPVEHSLSPRIFAHFFDELGVDAHYTALRVQPQELPSLVQKLRSGVLAGVSVTLPHKESIVGLLDDLHPTARRIGAVNCVARLGGRLVGHNTDARGFRLALERAGQPLAGTRLVLLGAGGAARAAAFAAALAGAKSVAIANRDPGRALRLVRDLCQTGWAWPEGEAQRALEGEGWRPSAAGPSGRSFVSFHPLETPALQQAVLHAQVLVNSTSVGLGTGETPLPPGMALPPGLVALDMVYRPLSTAFLRQVEAAGGRVVDGLWMLLFQAAEQFRVWTGRSVPAAMVERLHEELERELRA